MAPPLVKESAVLWWCCIALLLSVMDLLDGEQIQRLHDAGGVQKQTHSDTRHPRWWLKAALWSAHGFGCKQHLTLLCFHICSTAMAASHVHATVSANIANVGSKVLLVSVFYRALGKGARFIWAGTTSAIAPQKASRAFRDFRLRKEDVLLKNTAIKHEWALLSELNSSTELLRTPLTI